MSDGVRPEEEEREVEHRQVNDPTPSLKNTTQKPRSLSLRHFYNLAIVIILSATGLISLQDIALLPFSFVYMLFLSKVAFPKPQFAMEPAVFSPQNKILPRYVLFAAIIGLLLPILYILEGVYAGDPEGIKAASPHLFLLAGQIVMEGIAFSGRFSIPIRGFVPIFYNSRRIFTLVDWLRDEFAKVGDEHSRSVRRVYFGRGLAIANMALWCFNLFGFLLPVYLPRAFKIYYSLSKVKD